MPRALDPARTDARQSGATRYTSATPCKAGHEAGERYTSTGACCACVAGQTRAPRPGRPAPVQQLDPMADVLG